ncbi:hypothetical protein [Haladaptatus sp. DFWS20]|uniref:hypothetical protein n=1 Tax=Haladaptatus sp. DFWS20 TaxID=3403467 RepID=UPI003EB96AC8
MARDCSSSTDKTEKSENRIARRSYLKLAGSTAVSMAAVQAIGSVTAAKGYETIKIPEGGRKLFQIGSGETLENLLIDCTAPNADARIVASGSDWTIRNIGFKGQLDHSGSEGYPNHIAASGNGRIENVFVGNGVVGPTRKGGIGVSASHSGHIDIVRTHIAGWSDNGVYAAGMARPESGGHGTLTFDRCYCHDNNISSLRIASGGTKVKNTVIHNSKSTPKVSTCDCVNARGVYDGYGTTEDVIEFENVHIDCTDENTDGGASALVAAKTTYHVRDSQIKGRLDGNIETTNVGNDPKKTPPKGVPMTAEQAAQGIGAEGTEPKKESGKKKQNLTTSEKTQSRDENSTVTKSKRSMSNNKPVKKGQNKSKLASGGNDKACFTFGDDERYCFDLEQLHRILMQYL